MNAESENVGSLGRYYWIFYECYVCKADLYQLVTAFCKGKPSKYILIYISPLLLKQEFRESCKMVWLRNHRHETAPLIAA